MAFTYDVEETRGIALVGMSLSYALAGVLKRTAVLEPAAIEDAFEGALSSARNSSPPDDRSVILARQLLALMAGQLSTLKPESDQPNAMHRQIDDLIENQRTCGRGRQNSRS